MRPANTARQQFIHASSRASASASMAQVASPAPGLVISFQKMSRASAKGTLPIE
jgi:hypothetical protein